MCVPMYLAVVVMCAFVYTDHVCYMHIVSMKGITHMNTCVYDCTYVSNVIIQCLYLYLRIPRKFPECEIYVLYTIVFRCEDICLRACGSSCGCVWMGEQCKKGGLRICTLGLQILALHEDL